MTPYLLIGLIGAIATFVATPLVKWFSIKIGAIDQPSDRKVHANPTPTLGGMAIFAGILIAGAVASTMPEFEEFFTQSSAPLGIALAGLAIFILGVVDDFHPLPAPVKLAGQVFAAGILFLAGVKFQFLLLPSGLNLSIGDDVSVIVTVLWLVAMMNAVNLMDGLDGLAAGIVSIAAASFFIYTFRLSEAVTIPAYSAPLIGIILVGATLGFLRYNFYPAKIFMGDSGSMLLGLVLGAATIAGVGTADSAIGASSSEAFLAYFPLLLPLLVIAIPILDALLAVVRRARRRRSLFHADKEHLHHRLMDLGHGHRQAVIVMYVWSALAGGAGLAFTFVDRTDVIFVLPIAVAAIVLYTLFPVLTKYIQNRLEL